jgi:hypothetical protein
LTPEATTPDSIKNPGGFHTPAFPGVDTRWSNKGIERISGEAHIKPFASCKGIGWSD